MYTCVRRKEGHGMILYLKGYGILRVQQSGVELGPAS